MIIIWWLNMSTRLHHWKGFINKIKSKLTNTNWKNIAISTLNFDISIHMTVLSNSFFSVQCLNHHTSCQSLNSLMKMVWSTVQKSNQNPCFSQYFVGAATDDSPPSRSRWEHRCCECEKAGEATESRTRRKITSLLSLACSPWPASQNFLKLVNLL